tara:strand:+ start:2982 stop:4949 length:1968 start_codon:yes stop_codon:yes gene_type:complete
MKNKKLKQFSLINLLAGYIMLCVFVLLILFNRAPDVVAEEIASAKSEDIYVDDLFNGTHPDELTTEILEVDGHPLHYTTRVVHDNSVGYDYGERVVFDDGVVVHDRDDDFIVRDREFYIDNRDRIGTVEGGVGGPDRVGFVGRGGRGGRGGDDDVDLGILDRRLGGDDDDLLVIHNDDDDLLVVREDDDLVRDSDNIGLDLGGNDDLDATRFELDEDGRGSDDDLGDVSDFAENGRGEGKGDLPGIGEGSQVYAYNFPSQGVGAGIGNSAVGAGAGGGAGLGAGIGEAVLGGTTVPTLGGVGTYSSIQTVPPGTGTDKDGDGLLTETEVLLGTDPAESDSDGDGYSDGAEITSQTNPNNPASNPGIPGSTSSPAMGGVGGLVGGAGAGGAAGLVTGMVTKPLGMGVTPGKECVECVGECKGHGHGHGKHEYDLPPAGALHIMMHVDGSGSILNTRKQLEIMKDTLLKDALFPYYNNDEKLYNRRVTIVDGNGERTLQFFTEATKKDNVLALVFQDEAQPAYHLPTFNKKPQDHYSKDLQKLKGGLNGYGGLYRGIMFQVDRGKTFAKSFKEFVESAWQGTGYLENSNLRKYYWQENKRHIENKNGIVFSDEYHAKDSGDPQYYLDLIMDASEKVGLNLRAQGAGLTDGRYNKKTQ